jgi:hypothetical protein
LSRRSHSDRRYIDTLGDTAGTAYRQWHWLQRGATPVENAARVATGERDDREANCPLSAWRGNT